MTYPAPLTPESAALAQQQLRAGSGRCQTCQADVWRLRTSGDERLRAYDEVADGNWIIDDNAVARPVQAGSGYLILHSCLNHQP